MASSSIATHIGTRAARDYDPVLQASLRAVAIKSDGDDMLQFGSVLAPQLPKRLQHDRRSVSSLTELILPSIASAGRTIC